MTCHVRQFLGTTPHRCVTRFEELDIHGRRNLRAGLHAQIVAEQDDIDAVADGSQEPLEIGQVHLDDSVEKRVRAFRLARRAA